MTHPSVALLRGLPALLPDLELQEGVVGVLLALGRGPAPLAYPDGLGPLVRVHEATLSILRAGGTVSRTNTSSGF